MEVEKLTERLHDHEKRVIRALASLRRATTSQIARRARLRLDETRRATLWTCAKGLATHRKHTDTYLELTAEGSEYVRAGLPEKRLVQLVKAGIRDVGQLKRRFKKADIGLIWAKRGGWIDIREGRLKLTPSGMKALKREVEGERLLKSLRVKRKAEEVDVDRTVIKTFLRRGLIKKTVMVRKEFYLTRAGQQVARRLPRRLARAIGQLTPQLLRSGRWKRAVLRKYDIRLPAPVIHPGKIQPYQQIIDEVRERLIGLGFVEARGPLIETSFWNCDALFMPQDHPARGIHDIFFVREPTHGEIPHDVAERVRVTHETGWITGSKGWGGKFDFEIARRLLLRSHTTALSARVMSRLRGEDLPYKMFTIGRNFRPDVIDPKHFIEFYQCEGIVIGEGLTLRHLLAYLREIATALGIERIRFKPGYFPMTEPSVEGLTWIRRLGWVETLPGGIFRPELTLPLGIDLPVLAWGVGIDRLALVKLEINDIRMLLSDDLAWLRGRALVRL